MKEITFYVTFLIFSFIAVSESLANTFAGGIPQEVPFVYNGTTYDRYLIISRDNLDICSNTMALYFNSQEMAAAGYPNNSNYYSLVPVYHTYTGRMAPGFISGPDGSHMLVYSAYNNNGVCSWGGVDVETTIQQGYSLYATPSNSLRGANFDLYTKSNPPSYNLPHTWTEPYSEWGTWEENSPFQKGIIKQLTFFGENAQEVWNVPSLTSDGRFLYFISSRDLVGSNPSQTTQIFKKNIETGNLSQVGYFSDGIGNDFQVSGDGSRLVFRRLTMPSSIMVMNSDGTGLNQVSHNAGWYTAFPSVSNDGSKIAYVAFEYWGSGSGDIYTVNSDGTNRLKVYSAGDPRYLLSGDGNKILIETSNYPLHRYLINSDGTGLKDVLYDEQGAKYNLTLSFDGTYSLFVSTADYGSNSSHTQNLFRMKNDGSEILQITHAPDFPCESGIYCAPSGNLLSADGQKAVYNQNWRLNSDGGAAIALVRRNGDGTNPVNLLDHPQTDFGGDLYAINQDASVVIFASQDDYTGQNPNHSREFFAYIENNGGKIQIDIPMTFSPYYPSADYLNSGVMKEGKAFRWYRIFDQNGNPITNQYFRYRYNGGGEIRTGTTDDYGFVKIETGWLSKGILLNLEVLNPDNSIKADVANPPSFYVNVKDREFNQEWSLLFGRKGTLTGGGPNLKVGPIKFKTTEAGIGAGQSSKALLNYVIRGPNNTVYLSNEIDESAEAFASLGISGQIWKTKTKPLKGDISGGIEGKLRTGSSFKFEELLNEGRSDHEKQVLTAGAFLVETALSGLPQPFVGADLIISYLADKLTNLSDYQEGWTLGFGVGGHFKGGASFSLHNPLGKPVGSLWGVSLLDFQADGMLMLTEEEKTDSSRTYSLGLTSEIDLSAFKFNLSQKFGGDKRRADIPRFNLNGLFLNLNLQFEGEASISVEKENDQLKRIYLDTSVGTSSIEYSLSSEVTEKNFRLELSDGPTIDELGRRINAFYEIIQENDVQLNPKFYYDAFFTAFDQMEGAEYWQVIRADKQIIDIDFFEVELPVYAGVNLGAGIEVAAMRSLNFIEKRGKVSSLLGMMDLEEYQLDNQIEQNKKSLSTFFKVFGQAVTKALEGLVITVSGWVTDGVQQAGGMIQGAWNGTTGYLSKLNPLKATTRILIFSNSLKGQQPIGDGPAAATIGDVFIVNLTDGNGTPIKDFSSNPITLTLDYADQMLIDAGFDLIKAPKLSIYRWDGSTGYYVFQPSTVDTVNKKVTSLITKPGQYLMAIDETPPVISDFKVSNNTPTPIMTALVDGGLSGIDLVNFLFTLDGTTKVDGSTAQYYFDPLTGLFSFPVTTPLVGGSHSANLSVRDTGSLTATSQIDFMVNDSKPVIVHTPISTVSSGADIVISATITDDTGINQTILFYKPNNDQFSYQAVPLVKGMGDEYSAVISQSLAEYVNGNETPIG